MVQHRRHKIPNMHTTRTWRYVDGGGNVGGEGDGVVWGGGKKSSGDADHGNMVEVVDEEDSAELLSLEGTRQLHEEVHAGIPHAVQVVVQLPVLHHSIPSTQSLWF